MRQLESRTENFARWYESLPWYARFAIVVFSLEEIYNRAHSDGWDSAVTQVYKNYNVTPKDLNAGRF